MSASILVSQSASTPSSLTVTDNSTGLSGTITQRRVYVSNAYGEFLTGDGVVNYTEWALAEASIVLDILTEDIGALIKVEWLNVSNVVVAEVENTYPLAEYNKQFLYYLAGLQGLTPGVYQDSNYSGNIAIFWTNIIAGINAVEYGNDIAACQASFNRATQMRLEQNFYF